MNTGRHVYVGNATADPTQCTVSSYFAPEDCADFFSLYTLKENQFVSVQQGWEGREGVTKQQRWSAALWVSDIPNAFEREMAMTACGTCVQIKWTNRKKCIIDRVDAKVSSSQRRIGWSHSVINRHTWIKAVEHNWSPSLLFLASIFFSLF